METGIFGAVCLLVLTFTIAECGFSQEKRQTNCISTPDTDCFKRLQQIDSEITSNDVKELCGVCRDELIEYAERCPNADIVQANRDQFERLCKDSGATAIAGATILSTILVAVASAMN